MLFQYFYYILPFIACLMLYILEYSLYIVYMSSYIYHYIYLYLSIYLYSLRMIRLLMSVQLNYTCVQLLERWVMVMVSNGWLNF